jgi:hypothetical protein
MDPIQVSEIAQSVDKSHEIATFFRGAARMPKHANARDTPAALCARRKWPWDRPSTNHFDKIASPHRLLSETQSKSA